MKTVKIQQLDQDGKVWREFKQHRRNQAEVDDQLTRIKATYNISTTRVLVDGVYVWGVE